MNLVKRFTDIRSFKLYKEELIIKKTDERLFKGDEEFLFKGEAYCILEDDSFSDTYNGTIDIYDFSFDHLITIHKKGVDAGGLIPNTKYFSVDWEDENGNEYTSIYEGNREIQINGFEFSTYLDGRYKIFFNGFDVKSLNVFSGILGDNNLWSYTLPEGYHLTRRLYHIRKYSIGKRCLIF